MRIIFLKHEAISLGQELNLLPWLVVPVSIFKLKAATKWK